MNKYNQVYQIGLFGRSSAGKTSFLAALNNLRSCVVDGQTWTISYLPPVKGVQAEEPHFEKREQGRQLLLAGAEKLKNGEYPDITLEAQKSTLYRFQIESSGSKRIVDFIDYAGEFLSPDRLDDVKQGGFKLAEKLASCDAVFVLAPATKQIVPNNVNDPHQNRSADTPACSQPEDGKEDEDRNDQVSQALAQLNGWMRQHDDLDDIRRRPIGLLITKADSIDARSSNIEDYGTSASSVWKKTVGLHGADFTQWFAVSVRPSTPVLNNLIEPIVWAIDQSDEQLATFGSEESQVGFLESLKSPINIRKKHRALKVLSGVLERRFPAKDHPDAIAQTASAAKRTLVKFFFNMRLALVSVIFSICYLSLCVADNMTTNRFKRVALAEASSDDELELAESYFQTFRTRLFRLSYSLVDGDGADELRLECRRKRADRKWAKIQNNVNEITKGQAAAEFIDEFPESIHRVDALGLIQKANLITETRKYAQWFAEIEKKSKIPELTIEEREELINSLMPLPAGFVEDQKQAETRLQLRTQLANVQRKIMEEIPRIEFRELIESLLDDNQTFNVLEKFDERSESLEWPELQPTIKRMRAVWTESVTARVSEFQRDGRYEDGISAIDRAISDFEAIGSFLELPDQPSLRALRLQVREAWDKSEYEDFVKRPSVDDADRYLLGAHSCCMSQTVQLWRDWKIRQDKPFILRPKLSLTWDGDKGAWHPLITFSVQGKVIHDKLGAGDGDYGRTADLPETIRTLELKLTDVLDFSITMYEDGWFYDDVVCTEKGSFPVSELIGRDGKTGSLRASDATHTYRIRLLDMPPAPELIEWLPCQEN